MVYLNKSSMLCDEALHAVVVVVVESFEAGCDLALLYLTMLFALFLLKLTST